MTGPVSLRSLPGARHVVGERRRGERPRHQETALARIGLVGRERCVGGAEVDGPGRDRLDPASGPDRRIRHVDPGSISKLGNPRLNHRLDERRARALERCLVRAASARAAARGQAGGEQDGADESEDRLADGALRAAEYPGLSVIPLAECEAVSLGARGEEGDLERAVGDRSSLANQLMEPGPIERSVARFVDVEPVRIAGRLSVDEHAERHCGLPQAGP